mmetsp:Transcript_256/g.588  ORF Transcript_256/g.588 Transcript_256/m.588 type:complete len:261 (-) Transcript_256:799-1581(-)
MLGVSLDVAVTVLLAAALCARAPRLPVAPHARDRLHVALAVANLASGDLIESALATLAAVLGINQDCARAFLLALSTLGAASGPSRPIAEDAIYLLRQLDDAPRRIGVARIHFGLRAGAKLATATPLPRYAARPLLPTVARATAIAPWRPIRELAIDVDLGARHVLGTRLVFRRQADGPLSAFVRLHRHLARAPCDATSASRRARFPVCPLLPRTIDASSPAMLCVARKDLALVHGIAQLAQATWRCGNVAVTGFRTPAA